MRSLVLKEQRQPLAVVGFSVNDQESKTLAEIMRKADLPWRSFKFESEVVRQWYPSTPTFYAIDARGVIRNKWAGGVGAEAMDAALQKLIREAVPAQKKSGGER